MADTKVSALSSATTLQDADTVYVVQSATSKKSTLAALRLAAGSPTFTAMGALAVDFTKPGNTYSATSSPTFTYSNSGAPVAGDSTLLEITADSTARTITIPSTYSLARQGNITTLLVPASGTLLVRLRYLNSRYEIIGDPPATVGAGSYALTTGALTISALDIDWSTGNAFVKTLAANSTFTFSNTVDGWPIVVALTNTASNYTVTWPTVKWSGGAAPTQTVGAKTDVYTFIKLGSTIYGSAVQNCS